MDHNARIATVITDLESQVFINITAVAKKKNARNLAR